MNLSLARYAHLEMSEAMDYQAWVTYTDGQKFDILRQELVRISFTLKWMITGAAAAGTIMGSVVTIAVQHIFAGH